VTKEWSIENLIKESYPDNYQDHEIIDWFNPMASEVTRMILF
jgi:hypothetical protein